MAILSVFRVIRSWSVGLVWLLLFTSLGIPCVMGVLLSRVLSFLDGLWLNAPRVAVRYDDRLGEFYVRVRRRRGEQKALVAVACKMLKIIWFMLTRGEPYQSRNERLYGDKLYRLCGF
ncbi:MAG: hypothetical protein QW717_01710 [Candidatus Bathyarchaeia archaeon]